MKLNFGVNDRVRSGNDELHKLALYQLSYVHHVIKSCLGGVRSPNTPLQKRILYQLSYETIT